MTTTHATFLDEGQATTAPAPATARYRLAGIHALVACESLSLMTGWATAGSLYWDGYRGQCGVCLTQDSSLLYLHASDDDQATIRDECWSERFRRAQARSCRAMSNDARETYARLVRDAFGARELSEERAALLRDLAVALES